MEKKYELIKTDSGLYRIRAIRSFADVKEGDLGGYVQSEYNLSHKGTCWVYDQAKVYEKARILGNAKVKGRAQIHGYAKIKGCACIEDEAEIFDDVRIEDYALVGGKAKLCRNVHVCKKATVVGDVYLQCGRVTYDISDRTYLEDYIFSSMCIRPSKKYRFLFKRVNKVDEDTFCDIDNQNLTYKVGQTVEAETYDLVFTYEDIKRLNRSFSVIQVEVDFADIIVCTKGYLKVKKFKVLRECKID